jgi:hypothetical protein
MYTQFDLTRHCAQLSVEEIVKGKRKELEIQTKKAGLAASSAPETSYSQVTELADVASA